VTNLGFIVKPSFYPVELENHKMSHAIYNRKNGDEISVTQCMIYFMMFEFYWV
jgi:hypothetical protein